jgi:hypothetical protein
MDPAKIVGLLTSSIPSWRTIYTTSGALSLTESCTFYWVVFKEFSKYVVSQIRTRVIQADSILVLNFV